MLNVGAAPAPGLYHSRARVWSSDLGAFLQPDEYVFLGRAGTLWSWPGQNPYRWRDPSGRDAEAAFLRFAGYVEEALPFMASAAIQSKVPGLVAAGEAALLGLDAMNAMASLEAQRQSAAAIAKAAVRNDGGAKACEDEAEKNGWKPGPNDADWRGTGKGVKDALDDAFDRTGVPREDFEPTAWGHDAAGKSFPSEWRAPGGAEVNVDLGHESEGPAVPHVGWQSPGKRASGEGKRGHILLDEVPYNR